MVITGRQGKFSAGFDLATMTESTESMRELVTAGAQMLMRLYGFGLPTVAACNGHALAAGALVLLSCDRRIGAEGPAKIGLNEVAIGMALPIFAVELARDRLQPAQLTAALMAARIYDPAGAVDAGYLDTVVPEFDLLTTALAEARALGELRTGAYARTKSTTRSGVIERILADPRRRHGVDDRTRGLSDLGLRPRRGRPDRPVVPAPLAAQIGLPLDQVDDVDRHRAGVALRAARRVGGVAIGHRAGQEAGAGRHPLVARMIVRSWPQPPGQAHRLPLALYPSPPAISGGHLRARLGTAPPRSLGHLDLIGSQRALVDVTVPTADGQAAVPAVGQGVAAVDLAGGAGA